MTKELLIASTGLALFIICPRRLSEPEFHTEPAGLLRLFYLFHVYRQGCKMKRFRGLENHKRTNNQTGCTG